MRCHRAGRCRAVWAIAAVAIGLGCAPGLAMAASPISYQTLFLDPGVGEPPSDASLERHAIDLINATPSGARITFAFRDFNRNPVANALIAAHGRGVQVDGVIDGGERNNDPVKKLVSGIGPQRVVVCGSPSFQFNSCIANSIEPSLQHNKFMTFSELADGRQHVVLETSMNFQWPSQFFYYNDMVEIAGDSGLYAGYVEYLFDLKAQQRSADHFRLLEGDDGRNTAFTSPRAQRDRDSDDTIVDRLNEIDCSVGGSPSGKGLIRIAAHTFRTERAVIMRKLVDLHEAGCDVDVVVSYASGDIIAGLVSAGIPVRPFGVRAAGTRRQVLVHTKFWTVDAGSTLTGTRTKVTYAGSSNWRADEQYSDDLLLRMFDDGVYAAYTNYWKLMAGRATSDLLQPTPDDVLAPSSALTVTPSPNGSWNRSDVSLRIAASDGHDFVSSGLKRLHVEMAGAQSGSWDFLSRSDPYTVQELGVSAEGETTVTYYAEDEMGHLEAPKTIDVRIDKTPPTISGLPQSCVLWPPDNKLTWVADVTATDTLSGTVEPFVEASSNEPAADDDDIVIEQGAIQLRASKAPNGTARLYALRATASDAAGNSAAVSTTCTVPHSRGDLRKP